ncbi:ABC transporter permease, partial [Streptomyces caniscabiei]
VLGLIGFIVSPAFLTADNLIGVAQQSTELSLLVLATALILVAGRMDLSLESTIGVAPVIAVWLVLPTSGGRFNGLGLFAEWMAVPFCLAVGAVIGAVNGFLILKLRLNGFIVTLGMLTMLRGLQVALSEGQSIVELPSAFTYLGKAAWLGIPAAIWICAVLFALGGSALAWLRHGRALYAIGGNTEAARTAGIRVDRVVWIVLVLGSVLAAFAGILYSGHYGSLTLQLVVNVMTLAGVPPLWNQFLNGAIIIVALIISRFASGEQQE